MKMRAASCFDVLCVCVFVCFERILYTPLSWRAQHLRYFGCGSEDLNGAQRVPRQEFWGVY
jgi:hypothetical protein